MVFARARGRALLLVFLLILMILVPTLIFLGVYHLIQKPTAATPHHVVTASGGPSTHAKGSTTSDTGPWDGQIQIQKMNWSEASTWGGTLPDTGSEVTIPAGKTVFLDVKTPPLKGLLIQGTLLCDEKDISITSDWIMVHNGGKFQCGTEAAPFQHRATITLTGNDPNADIMSMGTKVLGVMGGTLELHGLHRVSWLHLAATAPAGSWQIVLEKATDWQIGDRIAIASTDYNPLQAEEAIITAINGTTLTLNHALKYTHWGQLQTFAGQNVDERAEVGLLSHNIVVQGDDSSVNTGFGGNTMILRDSPAHIENVEFYHMGQMKRLGRYPIHWHLAGDTSGDYAKNNSIDHSFNRCITLHGTNNVLLQSNVAFDTIGHCYFMEDGIETNNDLENNLGILTRKPADGMNLLPTDTRPATFWITNPNNTLRGNVAAGSQAIGFWYAFPQHPTGLSSGATNVWPRNTPLGVFSGNVAHSNEDTGLNVDGGPKTDLTSEVVFYSPRQNPAADSPAVTATFENFTAYKQRNLGVWLRGGNMVLQGAILADNGGGAIFAAHETFIQNSLLVGETDNKGMAQSWEKTGLDGRALPQPWAANTPIIGYSFYDGRVGAEHDTFVNFQSNSLRPASALGYLRSNSFPINVDNFAQDLRFVNANRVYMEDPHSDHDGDKAAVFLDSDGSITGQAGQYVVVKDPFLVNSSCTLQSDWNTNVCHTRYINISIGNDSGQAITPVNLSRSDGASVSLVGRPDDNQHVSISALPGQSYSVKFNGGAPSKLRLSFNQVNQGDWVQLAVPYPGGNFIVYRDYYNGNLLPAATSLAQLSASTTDTYYYDSGTQTLYVKAFSQPGHDWTTVFADPK